MDTTGTVYSAWIQLVYYCSAWILYGASTKLCTVNNYDKTMNTNNIC